MGCGDSKASGGSGTSTIQKESPRTFNARYKLGGVLGEGGYSVVKSATRLADGEQVAVKIVTRADLSTEDEESLRQEVQILQSLKHENIVQAIDFFEEANYFYIVLEMIAGGELFDRIVKKTYYNEKEARDLVAVLLRAIQYCHDKHIVHRDLKPENLLLTSKSDDANVKLADFGFAVYSEGYTITNQCGTPGYIAPEILENKPYGKPVDMWSFGVILYILLGGYPPFHDDNQRALFRKIIKGDYQFHPDYWSSVSDEAKDLIRGLLTLDPKKRLTVSQALNHAWVKKSDKDLAMRSLDSNLAELRKYQATRKFRAAVNAVRVVNRMKKFTFAATPREGEDDEAATVAPAESTTPAEPTARAPAPSVEDSNQV